MGQAAREQINIHEAKTHFSRLVARVQSGEEIVIARAGRPVAKLVAYREERVPRVPGLWRGKIKMLPGFDDPLPEEVLDAFRGGRP